jgi:hypothetical protein
MKANRLVAAVALLLSACASPTPHLDREFGNAVNAAKAQQTINPDASRNTDPVAGIDGPAAAAAVGEYNSSFRSPPPTFPVINVGVGGGGR